MDDLPFWLSGFLSLTMWAGVVCVVVVRIRAARLSARAGRNWASIAAIGSGLLSGLVGFPLVVSLLRSMGAHIDTGHAGIAYVVAVIINFGLGLFLFLVSRFFVGE